MGFNLVRTRAGYDTVYKQVEILKDTDEPLVLNRGIFIPSQYQPEAKNLNRALKAFYLDKHIGGEELRVPGETVGRLYVAHVCQRRVLPSVVVHVPIDVRGHKVIGVEVDMTPFDQDKMSFTEQYCKTAVTEAVLAVADGNYSGLVSLLPQ